MENNKIIIEHYINDADINGNPRDLLIIRDSYANKNVVKELVQPYIEANKDNLNFNGKKPKMKNLKLENGGRSVEEDRTNECFWIKDPELVRFIINNHNADIFKLTQSQDEVERNRSIHTSRLAAMREDSDRKWADAAGKWESRIGWRR